MQAVSLNQISNSGSRYEESRRPRRCTSAGSVLVEMVVGLTILSLSLVGLVNVYTLYVRTALRTGDALAATYLAEEGVEAVRAIRDSDGWAASLGVLAVDVPYYLDFSGGAWSVSTVQPLFIDGLYDRAVTFESVYRDANNDIASSGTLDTDARKLRVSVDWQSGMATTTKSLETYLTNIISP
jgi:type II secretory pathway pseudopilin PulG